MSTRRKLWADWRSQSTAWCFQEGNWGKRKSRWKQCPWGYPTDSYTLSPSASLDEIFIVHQSVIVFLSNMNINNNNNGVRQGHIRQPDNARIIRSLKEPKKLPSIEKRSQKEIRKQGHQICKRTADSNNEARGGNPKHQIREKVDCIIIELSRLNLEVKGEELPTHSETGRHNEKAVL